MAKPPVPAPSVLFRRVRRTIRWATPPVPPNMPPGRALPPEKLARLAAREIKRTTVDGEQMQISVDGGMSWVDLPAPAEIPVVDETLATTGEVWEDDGTGRREPRKVGKKKPG